ncbi:uncharacterized protein LOC131675297 [Phymastichus coffea]|uniref:uncharacterized protein LOC131675297 n=1 Tax=Phymastichus coffea TaxID=108790 RepID=UPI00273B64FA|nr:uncharacterized protein LOC131675297 [Phymastichus coffea]
MVYVPRVKTLRGDMMIPIIFAALCVAVATAESSSVSSHSTASSNMREYEYPSTSYLGSKPNYGDLSTTSYISSDSSPYAKSDSRLYSAVDPSSDSNNNSEPRTSPGLSGSYYKSKYATDTVVNALRPTSFHGGSSSISSSSSPSSSSQSSSSSASLSDIQSNHYPGNSNDFASNHPSSSNDYASGSSSFTVGNYGQRAHHQAYMQAEAQQPEYVGSRPTGTIYGSYTGAEYPQTRPTAYAQHSGLSGPPMQQHTLGHYPSAEDYSSAVAAAPPPHYKTYIMSGAPSYPTSKYSTVLGAIKSLFGGGSGGPMLSDAASSPTHLSSYSSMGPSSSAYYSPSWMPAATHHMPVSASSATGVGTAPPSYYLGSGLAPSTSAYSKSYAPMRLMSGFAGSGVPGGKVIVVRDSGSAHLGASYQPTAGLLMASSTSYPVKSKISFGPSSAGPTYLASPSSLQSYTSGPPSSSFPTSYSSSSSFAGGHGGSPFLGYTM